MDDMDIYILHSLILVYINLDNFSRFGLWFSNLNLGG